MRASVQAHPANSNAHLLSKLSMVQITLSGIVACLAWFVLPEVPPGKGIHGAYLNALLAVPTSFLHSQARGLQRGIGEYSCPADPRSGLGCNEETALSNPPQARQMSC
jgi:hypothetical protein